MGVIAEVGTMILLCALAASVVALAVRQRRRLRLLQVENDRWRKLASERADRAAMLSHELRTPLALISGSAEVLADGHLGALSDRQTALVDTIAVNAYAMANLSEDILASARIDTQVFAMRTQLVNVRRLARDVLVDLRGLHSNPLTLECRGYPPFVAGDPQLLRQALINLITNSVRHAGVDAKIGVAIRRTEDSVLLMVRDDGSGMSPEQRRELFNRTLKGKSDTGNGLGMIITQRIVELHGGSLLIDTARDRGTTIIARLPSRMDSTDSVER